VSPRGRTLVRILRLWSLINGRRFRPAVAHLSRELGVTSRTIYRDLNALEEAHWPVPPHRPHAINGAMHERRAA